MKKILVPTDFSPTARLAHRAAARLARQTGAQLVFLHVVEEMGLSQWRAALEAESGSDPAARMARMAEKEMQYLIAADELHDVDCRCCVEYGDPYTHIAEQVVQQRADMIVMGSDGASGLDEVLVGSTAERVIRLARCPVLTVKEAFDPATVKTLVYATDFNFEQGWVLRHFEAFRRLFDARLYIVQVSTPSHWYTQRTAAEQMHEMSQRHQLQDFSFMLYNDRSFEEGLHHFAEDVGADVIALATQGRTGLARVLHESLTERVANRTRRALWTVSMKMQS